ncbi:hypothetical protein [Micromonospora sp. NPDC049171]|uniref:hypothetical protein n=1 Tax=Micromonospora sp. NPDC049171 TaxID=3155770 RepID=UPI0033DDE40F
MRSSVFFDGSVLVVDRGKQMLEVVSEIVGALGSENDTIQDPLVAKVAIDLGLLRDLAEEPFDLRAVTERLVHSADQD